MKAEKTTESMQQFTERLEPCFDDLARYCRALCARWSPQEADDVLQATLLKGMQKFHQLKDITKFRPWVFQIATRTFYSSVRSNFWKRFVPIETNTKAEKMPRVFEPYEHSERKQMLAHALSFLSAKDRAAILLFEIAGFSLKEIAHVQGERSLSTVKSRLSRTRHKLKASILALEKGSTKPNEHSVDVELETMGLVTRAQAVPKTD